MSIVLNSRAFNLVYLPLLPRSRSYPVSPPRPPLRLEALLMQSVIVTHRKRRESSGDTSMTKSDIVTTSH